MTTNATNEETTWARAEKAAGERERRDAERRDLRREWELHHLRLAESYERIAADHRAKALELTLDDEGGGGRV